MSDLCTGAGTSAGTRARILTWLADGAREVAWALCSLPREHWAEVPPARIGGWPALRHARFLALRETHVTLPAVRHALGDVAVEALPTTAALDQAEAAWDAAAAIESAEAIVRGIGEARYELLQRLETAPDDVWERQLPSPLTPDASDPATPVQLDWVMLHARQREFEHVAAMWRVALYWDRVSLAGVPGRNRDDQAAGLPLHPADRLEESN